MITTSRGRVSVENYDEVGVFSRPSIGNQSNITSENQTMGIETESEYTTESIALKLFGSLSNLPQEYKEAEEEDARFAPSNKTMAVANEKQLSKVELFTPVANAVVKSNSAVSVKAKIAISTFSIVVLSLAILIAFTAVSVSAGYVGIGTLEAQYASQIETVNTLAEELSQINDTELLARAASLGYTPVQTSTSQTYVIPELRDAQTFVVEQGWFDQLCDFLSRMFN